MLWNSFDLSDDRITGRSQVPFQLSRLKLSRYRSRWARKVSDHIRSSR
jgi:hypothetical protein